MHSLDPIKAITGNVHIEYCREDSGCGVAATMLWGGLSNVLCDHFLSWLRGYFHSKHRNAEIFENLSNPAMLLFIGKLFVGTFR